MKKIKLIVFTTLLLSSETLATVIECKGSHNDPGSYVTNNIRDLDNTGTIPLTVVMPTGLGAVSEGWHVNSGGANCLPGTTIDEVICKTHPVNFTFQLRFTLTQPYTLYGKTLYIKEVERPMVILSNYLPVKWSAELPEFIDFGQMSAGETKRTSFGQPALVTTGSSANPILMQRQGDKTPYIDLTPAGAMTGDENSWILHPDTQNELNATVAKDAPAGDWSEVFTVTHTCD